MKHEDLKFNVNGKDYSFNEFVKMFPEWSITIERLPNPARDEYRDIIFGLMQKHIESQDEATEKEIEERILSISFDRVVELKTQNSELLDALEELLEQVGEQWDDDEEPETSDSAKARNKTVRAYKKAKSAIKRAKGE